jgi:hypothetical protein
MDGSKRKARFARWETYGLERIKADLLNGGLRLVGGTREVREVAWEWVRIKEAEKEEMLLLKPALYGVGIDLKAVARKLRRKS